MRIVHGTKDTPNNLDVPCYVCRRMVPLHECLVDLDGPAFLAYYHPQCLVQATDEQLA